MSADSLKSAPYVKVYSSLANAKTGIATTEKDRGPARQIRCAADGTLAVKCASGTTFEPMPWLAGETQVVQAIDIDTAASSGCVPITVYW